MDTQGESGRYTEKEKLKHDPTRTCQVFGQVWVVHEAVAGKLDTLKPDWDMNVIEPGGKKTSVNHDEIK